MLRLISNQTEEERYEFTRQERKTRLNRIHELIDQLYSHPKRVDVSRAQMKKLNECAPHVTGKMKVPAELKAISAELYDLRSAKTPGSIGLIHSEPMSELDKMRERCKNPTNFQKSAKKHRNTTDSSGRRRY